MASSRQSLASQTLRGSGAHALGALRAVLPGHAWAAYRAARGGDQRPVVVAVSGIAAARELAVTRRVPVAVQREAQRLDPRAHALGEVEGALEIGAREDDGELLAAVAGRLVDLARLLAQHRGHRGEHPVAGLVAVGVVDRLEVVDVEHDQADARLEAPRALDLVGQRLLEAPVV
jgi:hypothetical protein